MTAAKITAAATLLAALIGGGFLIAAQSNGPTKETGGGGSVVASTPVVSTSTVEESQPPVLATDVTSTPAPVEQPCVFRAMYQSCVSSNPATSVVLTWKGDSSQCVFLLDINWGDQTSSPRQQIRGGAVGATFTGGSHTYAETGTYTITVNLVAQLGNCYGFFNTLSFGYLR